LIQNKAKKANQIQSFLRAFPAACRLLLASCFLFPAVCFLLLFSGCRSTPSTELPKPAVSQIWGGKKGTAPGQFNEPRALAVARDGFVYAVDSSGFVQKWTDNGKFIKSWRVPSIDKGRPEGLAITKNGNIAVCDTHYSKIRIYTPDGKLVRSFGTYGTQKGGLLLATGICADADGFLYIADYGGDYDRISKWTEDGKLVATWPGHGTGPRQFRRPCGLTISREGDLLVADISNHRIQRLDRKTGVYKGEFGKPGRAPGQFTYPYGVVTDRDGFIYTVEYATSRVQKWTPEGKFITSWGEPGRAPGQLFNPWGLAIGPDNAIYIADTGNHRVQKIHLPQTQPSLAAG
jgi:DNA-binding beta-propeller fold protein YncE